MTMWESERRQFSGDTEWFRLEECVRGKINVLQRSSLLLAKFW